MTDAVAAKTDLQPAPGGLLDFAKFLTGTKTSGSENVSGSQATQGQTGPLESILAQLSDPNGLTNLVNGLFAKGALQVPGLTAQYANATGTRTSNNSMLGQSLAQLNQSLASSIAEAVVQQQKTAAEAAAKLGDINKTATTAKSGNTTAVQKPADLKTGIATGAGTVLGGTLINTLAKKFNLGGAAKDGSDSTSSVPAMPSTTDLGISPAQGFGDEAPLIGNAGSDTATDVVPSLSGQDLEPIDIPNSPVPDGTDISADAPTPEPDVTPEPDIEPDVSDDFWDSFFANGGIVLSHHSTMTNKGKGGAAAKMSSSYANGGEIENYADGGVIDSSITAPLRRNTPNFGPHQTTQSTASINIQPTASPATSTASKKKQEAVPAQETASGPLGEESSSNSAEAPSTPGVPSVGPISAAHAALGFSHGISLSALGPVGFGLGLGIIAKEIANALSGNSNAKDFDPALDNFGPLQEPSLNSPPADPPNFDLDGIGPPGSPDGLGPDDGGFDDNGNDGNESDSGDSGGDGGGDGGGGEANGGIQKASSIKEASGIDKKTIHVTPGEYVLPVDVTQALGVDMLDELVAHLHTPIGTKNVTSDVSKGRD